MSASQQTSEVHFCLSEECCCCSVTKFMSYSLWPHSPQHARLPCLSLSTRVCSNSCPLSQWCYLIISSSAALFSCLQAFPSSGSFPVSCLFVSGGQTIGASLSQSSSWCILHEGLEYYLLLIKQWKCKQFVLTYSHSGAGDQPDADKQF